MTVRLCPVGKTLPKIVILAHLKFQAAASTMASMTNFDGRDGDAIDPGTFAYRGEHDEAFEMKDGFISTGIVPDQYAPEILQESLEAPELPASFERTQDSTIDTPSGDRPGEAELRWLTRVQAAHQQDPRNAVTSRMLDDAAARYFRAKASDKGATDSVTRAAAENASMLESDDTPAEIKNHLVFSAIVLAVAVLSGAAAGAVGAALVKEVVSKEIIKGAVAGLITTTATIATDLVLQRPRHKTPNKLPKSEES